MIIRNTIIKLPLKFIFFIIYAFLCLINATPNYQKVRFEHLTENVALKQSNVNHIFQDSVGLMYFGTNEGLFLYDGVKSTLFWNHTSDESALDANNILTICDLPSSNILISSSIGLFVFNTSLQKFSPVIIPNQNSKNMSLVSSGDTIYMIWSNGFGQIKLTQDTAEYKAEYISYGHLFNKNEQASKLSIYCYTTNRSNDIIFATQNNQVFKFATSEEKVYELDIQAKNILCLYEDSKGYIWAGSRNNTLYRYNSQTKKTVIFKIKSDPQGYKLKKHVNSIVEDNQGNIIIGSSNNGLCIIKTKDKYQKNPDMTYFTSDPYNSNSLCDNNISYLYCDRSDAIFVGTEGNGINQVSLGHGYFTQHIVDEENDNSLDHIRVNAICDDNQGNIWFGTRLGLNRYHKATQQYYHYHDKSSKDHALPTTGVDSINEVTSLYLDKEGFLWIGSYGSGLLKYNFGTDSFVQYHDSLNRYTITDKITDVTQDKEGHIWICSHGKGFAKIENIDTLKSQIYLQYFHCDEKMPFGFASQYVDIIFQDNNQKLWFAMRSNGLFRFDAISGKMKHFGHIPGDDNSISNNTIISICDDSKGDLWIGTARGLNKFDIDKETFTSYTMESGLPHNSICGVLADNADMIWLYTQRGIYRFDPIQKKFDSYVENNRIFHEDYTIDATHKNKQGQLFLGTLNNGCIALHPDSIKVNNFIPKIIISDLKISNHNIHQNQEIDGRVILTSPINEQAVIDLNYKQNDISIEYTALSYNADIKQYFTYQMQGIDNKWFYTEESQKQIAYSNLQPGKYIFKIKAMNRDVPGKHIEKQIAILIHPPYWATLQAYIIYLFLFITLSILLYRYMLTRIRLKNDLSIERMKLGFFTNISHEFRTPLTLLSGPLQKLMQTENKMADNDRMDYYKLMSRNTKKMLQLVNQILDVRKIDNKKMDMKLELVEIISFVRDVCERFNVEAEEKNINFEYPDTTENLPLLCDIDKIEKVLYNLLSNAFKYTPDNESIIVEIQKNQKEQHIKIIVIDTGIGIPESQLKHIFDRFYRAEQNETRDINGTGLGLSIVKNFVEMHQGSVWVKNNIKSGCSFGVLLPMGIINDNTIKNSMEKITVSDLVEKEKQVNIEPQPDNTLRLGQLDTKQEQPLVLIVDDNAEMRYFLKYQLKDKYRIITADNGSKGLELAIDQFPELIISDVMMPNMNGLEFCSIVKNDLRICHIPIILLTARSSTDHKIEGIKTGADAYMTKPFDIDYLEARVRNLIDSRLRLRAFFAQSPDKLIALEKTVSNELDKEFLQKATQIVETYIEDPEFTVPKFIEEMGMSNSVLYRKLKALTSLSANEFVRHIRLKKALELLQNDTFNIAEVAAKVGFNDPKYFSTCFRKQYGKSPMQYVQSK